MATTKKFAVAGVSTLNGKTKIRFANDVMRIKILAKNGHKDVELVELPREMTKAEIAQHLTEIGFGSDLPAVQAAISYIAKKNPAEKQASTPAVKAAVVTA
jgi:ribosome maturation protein Sdo1